MARCGTLHRPPSRPRSPARNAQLPYRLHLPITYYSLENRQRHRIEEQEADLGRLKTETASLKRDHERLLAENGRFSDAVGELQSQMQAVSMSW